jgi:hypothetical protein
MRSSARRPVDEGQLQDRARRQAKQGLRGRRAAERGVVSSGHPRQHQDVHAAASGEPGIIDLGQHHEQLVLVLVAMVGLLGQPRKATAVIRREPR